MLDGQWLYACVFEDKSMALVRFLRCCRLLSNVWCISLFSFSSTLILLFFTFTSRVGVWFGSFAFHRFFSFHIRRY
jgi:hypothetical protein